jgi:hypothetical protein
MSTLKSIGNKLFKTTNESSNVELSNHKVELAFDFTNIMKSVDSELKGTGSAADKLNKAATAYVAAKKSYDLYQKVPAALKKDVDNYYKSYDKTAQTLGIDTKTTQFYKEYLDVVQKIGQIEDNVGQMKSAIDSSK